MQVSQIYFSAQKGTLPPFLEACAQSAKSHYGQLPHVLYDLDSAREFLSKNFDSDVLAAFDGLNPYAYKADLLRYCLLYAIGGWYFDIATRVVSSVDLPDSVETLAFRDMPIYSGVGWSCVNAVLYSKPGSPVYANAIQLVLENCRTNHYGINAVCPTGPVLIGKAFAIAGEHSGRIFGDYQFLTPMHQERNPAFILPNGTILALGKPSGGGDLTGVGADGTNNYNDFYRVRNVYRADL